MKQNVYHIADKRIVVNAPETGAKTHGHIPNSAYLGAEGRGDAAALEWSMLQRLERVRQFADNQIPAAEREAESIASGLRGGGVSSPESVKSAVGERLGADFSGVRFHTGASATRAAEDIGACAYTTGRDIYFGEGGFDSMTAAHELVHTAQQGAVESAAPVAAAPMGGVQMQPDRDFDAAAEKKGFWGGLGRRIASPFKFFGRMLGVGKAKMDDRAIRLAAEDIPSMAPPRSLGDAAAYAGNPAASALDGAVSSSMPTLVPTLGAAALGTGVNTAGGMFDKSKFGGLRDLDSGAMSRGVGSGFGLAGGAVSVVGGVAGVLQNAAKAGTSSSGGNTAGAIEAIGSAAQKLGTAASGGANIAGFAGAAPGFVANQMLPGLNVASGAVQAAKGTAGAVSGAKTQHAMTEQIGRLGALTDSSHPESSAGFSETQRLSLLRSMHMAREMGAIRKEAGVGEAIAGGLTTAGGIATLSGAGALPGTILSGAGTGLSVLSGFNKSVQVGDMRGRVADQELDMEDRIREFDREMADLGEKNDFDKATKESIILQRLGFKDKTEVFMNIAMNRSKALTDMANSRGHALVARKADPNADDEKKRLHGEAKYEWEDTDEGREKLQKYRQRKFARETLKGMGLSKVRHDYKTLGVHSGYAQQGAAEKLGMEEGVDIGHQLAKSRGGEPAADVAQKRLEQARREALGTQYAHKYKESKAVSDDQSKGETTRFGAELKSAWYAMRDGLEQNARESAKQSLVDHELALWKNRDKAEDPNAGGVARAVAKGKAMWHHWRREKQEKRLGLDRQKALGLK